MKQEDIFKKIGVILNELKEQYQFIEKTKDDINDLELELFAANTQFLIENIEVLRKHNKQKAIPTEPAKETSFSEKFFEPVVQPAQASLSDKKESLAKADDIHEPETKEDIKFEEPIIRHQLDVSDIDSETDEEDNVALEPDETAVEEVTTVDIPDKLNEPAIPVIEEQATVNKATEEKAPVTINQIIAAQMASSRLADKFELPTIKDLKSAININDKLLYVKDLFNGYSLAYSEAIEILNRFNKFEEADAFLKNNYIKKNNWETKQATADKFYTILRRRYPD